MLERLEKVLAEMERHGYNGRKVVDFLVEISGLEERRNHLEKLVVKSALHLQSAGKDLQEANEKVTARKREMEKLHLDVTQTGEALAQLQHLVKENNNSIQLASTFIQLLHGPGTLVDFQILKIQEILQQVLKARNDVRGLPVDYKGLQAQFHGLVETVLGDTLLPRDRLNKEMIILHQGWTDLHRREKQLAVDETNLDNAAWEKLVVVALSEVQKGRLFLGRCTDCKTVVAIRRGSKTEYYFSYKCPMCWKILDTRELPQQKQVPA